MGARVVAVTGAGSGIGAAIARRFAERGDLVVAGDLSMSRLEQTIAALDGRGDVRPYRLDVRDFDQMRQFVQAATAAGGRLDVFVNSAGVFDGSAGVVETSPDLWRSVIDVNLTGSFHGCKVASSVMLAQRSGRIVTIGSVGGQRGAADGIAYDASKAGIEGMTRRLAVDLGPHGITANVVAPGVIRTAIRHNSAEVLGDLVDTARGVGTSPELMDVLIPAHRAGEPAEVAAVVEFLASDEAGYINGHVLHIDGGWNAR